MCPVFLKTQFWFTDQTLKWKACQVDPIGTAFLFRSGNKANIFQALSTESKWESTLNAVNSTLFPIYVSIVNENLVLKHDRRWAVFENPKTFFVRVVGFVGGDQKSTSIFSTWVIVTSKSAESKDGPKFSEREFGKIVKSILSSKTSKF